MLQTNGLDLAPKGASWQHCVWFLKEGDQIQRGDFDYTLNQPTVEISKPFYSPAKLKYKNKLGKKNTTIPHLSPYDCKAQKVKKKGGMRKIKLMRLQFFN